MRARGVVAVFLVAFDLAAVVVVVAPAFVVAVGSRGWIGMAARSHKNVG